MTAARLTLSIEDVLFFESSAELWRWLEANHDKRPEQWIGYYKKGSARRGISYPESVDEALCFGWIDGLTRGIDESRYATRFTPRRLRSNWSKANIRRLAELTAAGRMTEAGRRAFEARREPEPGTYTYETRPADLPDELAAVFRTNPKAWEFWRQQTPGYRKSMTWWIVSAKQDVTRQRRLAALIDESAAVRKISDINLPKLGPAKVNA